MSTRCNIIIKSERDYPDIVLYHHHDGYPQGVGYDLYCRLNSITGTWYATDIANNLVKEADDEYEITCDIHGDIEYLYTIDCKNKILKCNIATGKKIGKEVELMFNKGELK